MENLTFNSSEDQMDITQYKASLLAIHSVLFVLIVVGNVCVLSAIAISGQGRKTRMNFFIMHLAIADLSVGFFYVALEIAMVTSHHKWIAGIAICKLLKFSQALVMYASTYMLVSLSIDRFDAIARPMKFSRKAFRARLLVCTSWLMAAVFSIPSLILFETKAMPKANNATMCVIHLVHGWMWQTYMTLIFFACFVIPAMVIAVCYIVIAVIIWKKSKAMEAGSDSMCNLRDGQAFSADYNPSRCGVTGSVIHQAKIRTIKMTFIIVTAFIICWSPYFIIALLQVYGVLVHDKHENRMIIVLLEILAPLNSAINPLIYGVFSTRICGNLRQVPIFNGFIKRLQCCKTQRKLSHRYSRSASENGQSNNGPVNRKVEKHVSKSKCIPENDTIVTLLRTNSDQSKQQHVSFTQPLTNGNHATSSKVKGYRRPSGLPLVKRHMTEEENILLKSLTRKLKKVP